MKPSTKINFVIQSTDIKTGSKEFYKSLRDKDGYYELPGIVFGKASRNNNEYETNSLIECITNPMSRFYRTLTENNLNGEWGHPMEKDFGRLTKIFEQNHCLFIKSVRSGKLKSGDEIVWVKFKPCGVYGKVFEEALEDPDRNANLSIRVACTEGPMRNGVQLLYPRFVVTFDGVGAGGYAEASKRTAIDNTTMGMEDLSYIFTENDLTEEVGNQLMFMENYNKDCLLEHFRADSITVNQKIITLDKVNPKMNSVAFHSLFLK